MKRYIQKNIATYNRLAREYAIKFSNHLLENDFFTYLCKHIKNNKIENALEIGPGVGFFL